MGQIVLEIPQDINRTFHIESEEKAADILEILEDSNERSSKFERGVASGAIKLPTRKFSDEDDEILGIWADRPEAEVEENSGIVPPRRNSLREDGEKVLGIWADRPESAQEIARQIRERNRKVT
jgi:hypothetical protein